MRALKIGGVLMKFRKDVQNMDKTCLKVNTSLHFAIIFPNFWTV